MKKNRLISLALALVTVTGAFTFGAYAADDDAEETETIDYFNHEFATQEDKLATMELMLSLYGYELYFEPVTGEVAYKNTETGAITFTNPYDVSKSGGGGSDDVKSMLLSQIILSYEENGKSYTMYSYTEAAARGQINVKYVKNGIRVEYAMGRLETRRLLPKLIEKTKFEQLILANITNEEHLTYVRNFYTLEDPEGKSQSEVSEMNARVPITEKMAVYVLQSDTTEREMNILESYIKLYCPDFTYEVLAEIHDEVQYVGTDNDPALFRLSLEYYLDEYGLQIRLPANGIRFNESRFTLDSIKILPYFGAASQDYDGYTLYPDGGGTLIRFEDLTSALTLSGKLYGSDFAYQNASVSHSQTVRMPVYGVVENYYREERTQTIVDGNVQFSSETIETDRGFFAIVEDGESLASITSEHGANATHKFNSAYTTFSPRPKDTYSLADAISVSADTTWTVVSDRKYTGSYTIRIIQLNDAKNESKCSQTKYYEASYVGMAKAYRDYLESTGKIKRVEDNTGNIPLYIESFGELDTSGTFLTFPTTVEKALTTFDNIKEMYDWFAEQGVTNINFRLVGFNKGGMLSQAVPYHVDFEKVVGGDSGFKELAEYANEKGFGVYPDFDFAYSHSNTILDGFSYKKDAVKSIDGRYTLKLEYSAMIQGTVNTSLNCISPGSFIKMFTSFDKDYSDIIGDTPVGISVSTLGSDINSDFDTSDPYNREDAKQFIEGTLERMNEKYSVMVDGGNAYAIPYANHILNAPLDSSHFTKASEAVPFFGMVYHGYVNFAGTPTNMAGDTDYEILKMIENGAYPYFTLSYQNTTLLKNYSDLVKYYSIDYNNWREDVVSIYNEVNSVLGSLISKRIDNHEFLEGYRVPTENELESLGVTSANTSAIRTEQFLINDGTIVRVSYEGGTSYLLNYNYFDVTVGNITIPAMGYIAE